MQEPDNRHKGRRYPLGPHCSGNLVRRFKTVHAGGCRGGKAGIEKSYLVIALEPEAASLYCKYLPLERKGEGGIKTFTSGSKYVVLDAGGGTIDITVHEVQRDGSLKEIHKANGGDWGGTKVDHAFQLLLSGIIGNGAFRRFMENNKADMIEFLRDFEVKKRTIGPDTATADDEDEKVTFKVPITMNEACKEKNRKDINTIVKSKQQFKGNLSLVGDKLRVSRSRAKELFEEPTKQIVDHLKKLLKESTAEGVESILMVGGFSESLVLQDSIKKNFPNLRMIVPQDAGLAVLKGAVIFGQEPLAIKKRVCKYTYGIKGFLPFDENKHDPSKRFITSTGVEKCNYIFDIHVRTGECVEIGKPQTNKNYRVIEANQTSVTLPVYVSTEENPKYVTDPGCTQIGTLDVDLPDTSKGLNRSVTVHMTFGLTELEVEVIDNETGKNVAATFDFL